MEYTSLIDTSLDLNLKPHRVLDDAHLKQEAQSNFIDQLGRKLPVKEEAGALVEELNRVSAENQKLTQMLTVMCENYDALRKHLVDYMSKNPSSSTSSASKKRKSPAAADINNNNNDNTLIPESTTNNNNNNNNNIGPSESSSSDEGSYKKPREEHIKAKVSRVYVRTEASDTTLIVKDGYQWRKYGQKVTRDNPSPRAYFKCSFAPTCPVKKKVQRSVEDQSILVATYEGEHNHPHPSSKAETAAATSSRCVTTALGNNSVPCSTSVSVSSTGPTITLDLTKPKAAAINHQEQQEQGGSSCTNPKKLESSPQQFQHFLIEQMASSLTKDPSFKAALAAAISGKFLQHNQTEKW